MEIQAGTLDCSRAIVLEQLGRAGPRLLQRYDLAQCVHELDRHERGLGYHVQSKSVELLCGRVREEFGLAALDLYLRMLLLHLIERYQERCSRYRIPQSLDPLISREFERIVLATRTTAAGFYSFGNDLFLKDLGICRLKVLPCGSEVVDLWSGIPRSLVARGGVSQFIRAISFVGLRTGGFSPFYESHWDRRLIRLFTPHDYDLFYLRVAELLTLNSNVKGLMGASWWFDPVVEDIAPSFAFLRRTPLEHGAMLLRVGPDSNAIRDATSFSGKRRALYESGAYVPMRYMLVWGRDDLLRWARSVASN